MNELNERAALNHQLREDARSMAGMRRRAVQRMAYRCRSKAARQRAQAMALDGALLGAAATGLTVLVTLALI